MNFLEQTQESILGSLLQKGKNFVADGNKAENEEIDPDILKLIKEAPIDADGFDRPEYVDLNLGQNINTKEPSKEWKHNPNKWFHCKECSKIFNKERTWYRCTHCNHKELVRRDWKIHVLKQHSVKKNKQFECEFCGYHKFNLKTNRKLKGKREYGTDSTMWFECSRCALRTNIVEPLNSEQGIFSLE